MIVKFINKTSTSIILCTIIYDCVNFSLYKKGIYYDEIQKNTEHLAQ